MKTFALNLIAFLLITVGSTAFADGGEIDGLVRIKARKVDQAYLLPGADFSSYKKVMIAPAEVAFQKNWLRNMNNRSASLSQRIEDKDAKEILDAARSGFDEIWAEAFKAAGYEVVHAPADDALKLVPSVFDLYINAPDITAAVRNKSYTVEAGRASLSLDVRDSVSGALLGRAIDKRIVGDNAGRLEWTTRVSNRADFNMLFKRWAKIATEGLDELKQSSPLPATLQPGQKLPQK